MTSLPDYHVSVTALSRFSCRRGDLEGTSVVGPSSQEGIKTHQKVQRQIIEQSLESGRQVDTECKLTCSIDLDRRKLVLSGRVDLLDQQSAWLSEVKTTYVPAEQVPESQRVLHWAQLYLYGFLFLSANGTDESWQDVNLELLYVNIRANEQEFERRLVSRMELVQFANKAIDDYVRWLDKVVVWQQRLRASASVLKFPHAQFRAGQRDMAAAVYRSARDAQALMCEAPTGTGKTISTLFPAVKSLGEGTVEQVIYLTAKVSGRASALQSLMHMERAGLVITAMHIRSRQNVCFCSIGRCERDDKGRCPMTLGFYDRLSDARDELLSCGIMTDSLIDEIAWNHQLCPFELALQMLPWVQIVVADYNYVFDPLVSLSYFNEAGASALLLIDEAHNLVDRSRSMYSARLSRSDCMEQAAICRQAHAAVANALDRLVRQLLKHGKESSELNSPPVQIQGNVQTQVSESMKGSICRSSAEVIEAMVATMGKSPALPESCNELFRILCRFVVISELFAEHHRAITSVSKSGARQEVQVELFCLDASSALMRHYRKFRASIAFSATLRPATFYRDSLGMPDTTGYMQLSSPFNPEFACHSIVDWIDTRYRSRQRSMAELIELIFGVCSTRNGNYLIFFPSYAYLEQAHLAFTARYPSIETWRQKIEHSRDQQREQLDQLETPGHRIGFAILGGVYGEGVDYVGDRLIGVIVVSPGLPGLNTQTQLLSNYFQHQGHNGYDFAYRYPGFTRVLQTVGRLVRDEHDRGVVVLVDERFRQRFYQELFPEHWQIGYPQNQFELVQALELFWDELSKP